ncbi:MAG TPA: 3D domain-containing protein [Gaiellaceae bacterium]|nr:3D domain-containing protein [Gaiellaceae bacterium]
MGEPGTALRAGIAAACVALLAALQLPAASGAESSSKLRAQSLRDENAALAGQARAAWLSSVSLGTRLEQTRAGLAQLQARTRSIAAKRTEADESLRLARRTLTLSQRRLARRVRLLYEQGDSDPMAVLVGAKSLEEALSSLESIHRIARQDRLVIEQAEAARTRLIRATKRLAAQEAQARRTEAATSATLAALETARREQAAQLAAFRAERSSNSAAISSLEADARDLAAAPTRAVSEAGRTLTVSATGYSLKGRTSTGVSVGYGVVAVDPGVIPLGTKMTIPGYGEGVAADTGGAVVGARIDLWFPTRAEALAWGTRTVSITLH